MIRTSLLSSLVSATLHGGVVAAVALSTLQGDFQPQVSAVRVIFEEKKPSVGKSDLSQTFSKPDEKLSLNLRRLNQQMRKPTMESEDSLCVPGVSAPLDTEAKYEGEGFFNPLPSYPLVARKRGHEGSVVLRVSISVKGRVEGIKLKQSSGWSELDEVCMETIKAWQFMPATRAGIPASGSVDLNFQFQLTSTRVRLN